MEAVLARSLGKAIRWGRCQQEHEVSVLTASTVKKEAGVPDCFPFYSAWLPSPSPEKVLPTLPVGLPSSVGPLWKRPGVQMLEAFLFKTSFYLALRWSGSLL